MKKTLLILIAVIGLGFSANAQETDFVLKKNSKIIINTFVLLPSQSKQLCNYLTEEFNKLGFCCVSRMEDESEKDTADVIIYVHATPASVTFNVFDKALDKEVFIKTVLFKVSVKGYAKPFIKEIKPFIEK